MSAIPFMSSEWRTVRRHIVVNGQGHYFWMILQGNGKHSRWVQHPDGTRLFTHKEAVLWILDRLTSSTLERRV